MNKDEYLNKEIDRQKLIEEARLHIIDALHDNVEIIATYDLKNDFDYHFINNQIDDTIKLLQLLKVRFISGKDLEGVLSNDI